VPAAALFAAPTIDEKEGATMRSVCALTLAAALMLFAQGAVRAQTTYKIQPIVKVGDNVGGVQIKAPDSDGDHDVEIGTLNDAGQIIFVTDPVGEGEALIQYDNGKFIPIVIPGTDAPGGKWAATAVDSPVSMNQAGNVVFAADVLAGDDVSFGTFLWDSKTQKVTALAVKGMPAVNNLTFESAGYFTPTINNNNEVALIGEIKNAAGEAQRGVFFAGKDGKLVPVAIPDQPLPDGGKVQSAAFTSINDAGVVAMEVLRAGDEQNSAYVWKKGTLTPVAVVGADAPGGGKFARIAGVRLNNKNKNVLVDARVGDSGAADALYLFADGKLLPVAVPGKDMPEGGKFKTVLSRRYTISYANDAGQIAFAAVLEDNSTAAYLMDADGKLSLIVKSGMTTDLGKITEVGDGHGLGLNNKGQIAVNVTFNDGPPTMILLTPQ
jgi:hypothetical protein